MGWTYLEKPEGSLREFFEKEFSRNGENRIVEFEVVGDVAYIAIRREDGIGGLVCLLVSNLSAKMGFGYKAIPEEMGPCCYDCPRNVLEALTATPEGYASVWREKCWEIISEKEQAHED